MDQKALVNALRDKTILAAGLDVHTVIAGKRGDIGTLTFQPYLLRIDDAPAAGGLFEDEHDWALQWRIANFNYTGLGHGRFNVRVGHFEIPFGLTSGSKTAELQRELQILIQENLSVNLGNR